MSNVFTVLLTREFCNEIGKAGDHGKPLTVLFGGIHRSCPSLERAGIVPGDVLFPLQVYQGNLHIIARAVAKEFLTIERYLKECLGYENTSVPEYEKKFGPLGHKIRLGVCGIHALVMEQSTPIRFDVVVPPEKLESVKFCPRKGPEMGLRGIKDGKLKSAISLQGFIRRLCPETANMFSQLVGVERDLRWAASPSNMCFEIPL